MTHISYYKDKANEAKKRLEELQKEERKQVGIIAENTTKWQELCSHPKEYIIITNRYYEDDYGKRIREDPKDWEYKCQACNKHLGVSNG